MNFNPYEYEGKIFNSPKHGLFRVNKYLGIDPVLKKGLYEYEILKTGGKGVTRKFHIDKGDVGDPHYGINPYKIQYSNNYGPYEILQFIQGDRNHNPMAKIKFIYSGNIKIVYIDSIKNGYIKDETNIIYPLNTNFLDKEELENRLFYIKKEIYNKMIGRCYKYNNIMYSSYGKKGITVCDRWRNNFEAFCIDTNNLFQYNKYMKFFNLLN